MRFATFSLELRPSLSQFTASFLVVIRTTGKLIEVIFTPVFFALTFCPHSPSPFFPCFSCCLQLFDNGSLVRFCSISLFTGVWNARYGFLDFHHLRPCVHTAHYSHQRHLFTWRSRSCVLAFGSVIAPLVHLALYCFFGFRHRYG